MKVILKYLAICVLLFTVTSCLLEDNEQKFDNGSYVLMFPSPEVTGFFLNDNGDDYTYTVPLSITGGDGFALDTNVSATFEIDPSSTANQGIEFDLVDTSGSVLIEAGNTFTNLPIVIHSGALNPDNPATVVINILDGSSSSSETIVASGNKSQVTINLQATCTSDLAGDYELTVNSSNGASNFHALEPITEIGPGEYITNTSGTWDVGVLNGGTREGFIFKEVCGKIFIEEQNLAGIYSNLLSGTDIKGTVDPVTGDITLEYTIGFGGNTVFNTYTATYKKL